MHYDLTKYKDGEMTGAGMAVTLATGERTTVRCADRVLLINGMRGVIHCWTGGGFMVTLDNPIDVPELVIPVKAFDCKGNHVAVITERCPR